jgi:hypothetical protein
MVPSVHPSIIAMMELLVEQIADYLCSSTEQVLSSLTLGEFNQFWGHVVGTKCFKEGLGLWGKEFINEHIRLYGEEMAKYLDVQLDQLQNISNRDFIVDGWVVGRIWIKNEEMHICKSTGFDQSRRVESQSYS